MSEILSMSDEDFMNSSLHADLEKHIAEEKLVNLLTGKGGLKGQGYRLRQKHYKHRTKLTR